MKVFFADSGGAMPRSPTRENAIQPVAPGGFVKEGEIPLFRRR
jgi:hypothetical protein